MAVVQGMRRLQGRRAREGQAGPDVDRRDRPRRHAAAASQVGRLGHSVQSDGKLPIAGSERRGHRLLTDPARGRRRAARPTSTSPPGVPPTIRVARPPGPPRGLPDADAEDTREIIYSILTTEQRQRLENDLQLDFAYVVPGQRPLPRQRLLPARRARRRLPPDPERDRPDRQARPAAGRPRVRPPAARPRARDRPDRLRQVDVAGLDDRRDQRTRDEHIVTIEDPIEFLHAHKRCIVNQRELGPTPPASPAASRPRCARTPT